MGSSASKEKKSPEEESKKKEEEDKSKSKEISKDNEKEKEKSQSKRLDTKSNKDEKLTNPIINQNNLQPNKDNTISKVISTQQQNQNQIQNKNESQKIFTQTNPQLPSAIVKNNIEGTSSVFPTSLNQNKKKPQKNSVQGENVEKEEEKPKLLINEHLIAPLEGQLFPKVMTDNQMRNLDNYNANFYPKGEHIILSFGDTFDLFDNFFKTIFSEHELYKDQPIYNYNTLGI